MSRMSRVREGRRSQHGCRTPALSLHFHRPWNPDASSQRTILRGAVSGASNHTHALLHATAKRTVLWCVVVRQHADGK